MSRARKRVLVVDDEQDVLHVTSELLKPLGLDVVQAASGPEALQKAGPGEGRIDLLITDLIMPGMTGRMLADVMLARFPGLDVIFMSGHVDARRVPPDDGDVHFIQKPYLAEDLRALVRELLDKRKKTS